MLLSAMRPVEGGKTFRDASPGIASRRSRPRLSLFSLQPLAAALRVEGIFTIEFQRNAK